MSWKKTLRLTSETKNTNRPLSVCKVDKVKLKFFESYEKKSLYFNLRTLTLEMPVDSY